MSQASVSPSQSAAAQLASDGFSLVRQRRAGVLLDLASLAAPGLTLDLENRASAWLEKLKASGFTVWQLLPLGPRNSSGSPYSSPSWFALDVELLAPSGLVHEQLLSEKERVDLEQASVHNPETRLRRLVSQLLAELSRRNPETYSRFEHWRQTPQQLAWLPNWTLFRALKERFGEVSWLEWPEAIRLRETRALDSLLLELEAAVQCEEFLQFLSFETWDRIRSRSRQLGILLVGDLPIYPDLDSAEVWSQRERFELDQEGQPLRVAGVPPDYFSSNGQLWGNPVYRWEVEAGSSFQAWRLRLGHALRLFDAARLDHFRGFAAYWAIPRGACASQGSWLAGPGRALFEALEADWGRPLPVYAEDLGTLDPEVHELREACGIPGTRVLQFGFLEGSTDHLPHRLEPSTVLFTGTHDNDTARGFLDHAPEAVRARALDYLGCTAETFPDQLVRAAWNSVARLVIVPLQDLLGLGSEGRLNRPGIVAGNWSWRLPAKALEQLSSHQLRRSLELAERIPAEPSFQTEGAPFRFSVCHTPEGMSPGAG